MERPGRFKSPCFTPNPQTGQAGQGIEGYCRGITFAEWLLFLSANTYMNKNQRHITVQEGK
jgi:hypothetical protein